MYLLPLALLLAAAPAETAYRPLDLSTLAQGQPAPGLVRVSGRYLAEAGFSELVRGVVSNDRYALRVEGQAFDWTPKAGELVELWGLLQVDERGSVLRFHNGRRSDDASRAPRPSPALAEGQRTRLWLKVTEGGASPFPLKTGTTEDGRSVMLPASYRGPFGLVCLQGTLGTLGRGFALREPSPCKDK
ncbi:hypothetical protein JRI60_39165 [Archangium violaceum]|uniref:hypothetical protein n=1 Tax=Archangium violaceum TaxID=83451 RepID=UPI00194EB3F3|nr:hypothetical protein [Archangium violaceum]QRN95059.1 hypothetical protein JRI60_39165 [Archangium violaceum]